MSQALSTPQALSSATARLGSGVRATLELADAAMAGEGHLDAAERQGASRSRPIEISLRRLPAIIIVLLLVVVVLAGMTALFLVSILAHAVGAAVAAVTSRQSLVALR